MALEQLESPDFWRTLAPDLTISPPADMETAILRPPDAAMATIRGIFDREGYIQLPRSQDLARVERLAHLIRTLHQHGMPPVFAFLFEETWQPFRRLGAIFDGLLAAPHAVMPDFWAWHVDPGAGEAGWPPHVDRVGDALFPDMTPKAISAWIPLTDATPLNGCMYVIPKLHDPLYGQERTKNEPRHLPDIRALPAGPGDSLIWTQALVHWGSRTSALGAAPRISMSVEFQRADLPPFSIFKMPPHYRPTFEQKLALIGAAILKYQHMQPYTRDLTDRAAVWRDRIPQAFGTGGHA